MSSTVAISGHLFDISRAPQADAVTFTMDFPRLSGATNVGVTDDGIITSDPVVVAAAADGSLVVMLIPATQIRADNPADLTTTTAHITGDEAVTFIVPDTADTISGALAGETPTIPAASARAVVYQQSKVILQAGSGATVTPNDAAQTIEVAAPGSMTVMPGPAYDDTEVRRRLDAIEADDWVTRDRIATDAVGGREIEAGEITGGDGQHIAEATIVEDRLVRAVRDKLKSDDDVNRLIADHADVSAAPTPAEVEAIIGGAYRNEGRPLVLIPRTFATVEPAGIPGIDLPEHLDFKISQKDADRVLESATLNVQGQPGALSSDTPISEITDRTAGVLRFDLPQVSRDNVERWLRRAENAARDVIELGLTLNYFGGGSDVLDLPLLIRNDAYAPASVAMATGGTGDEWARWNINNAAANAAAAVGGVANQPGSPLTIVGSSQLSMPLTIDERLMALRLESYVGAVLHARATVPIMDMLTPIETGPDRSVNFTARQQADSDTLLLSLTDFAADTASVAAGSVRIRPVYSGVGADGDTGATGPRGPSPDLTLISLGAANLAEVGGVTNRNLPNPAAGSLSAAHVLHFSGSANGYDASTGLLTLPAGTWRIEAEAILDLSGWDNDNLRAEGELYLYNGGTLLSQDDGYLRGGLVNDPAFKVARTVTLDAAAVIRVQAAWRFQGSNRQGNTVTIRSGFLTASMLATADASTTQGGSGTSSDGSPRPYQVVLYGRFADSALSSGEPPRPNIVILSDGPSVAPGVWHLDPTDATGADHLWRAEARAAYHNGAWGHGDFSYSRVNPADGAFQFASDASGTGASESQFSGWTHYRIRNADGTLGDWLPRSGMPAPDAVIWNLLTDFGAGTHTNLTTVTLTDYRELYCTWGQYTAGFAERSFFRASDAFPVSGIRSITSAEADAQLLRDGRVLRCTITPSKGALYLRNEAPSGATETVGCDLAFVLVRSAPGLTDQQFDEIRIPAGAAGAGRIDMWGRA